MTAAYCTDARSWYDVTSARFSADSTRPSQSAADTGGRPERRRSASPSRRDQ